MVMPFAYPGNAMINFQPLDSALKDYQTGMQVAGESTAKIDAANAMKAGDFTGAAALLAKVDPRAAMELQKQPGVLEAQRMQNEETTRKLLGGTAEALSAIQDPALQQQTLQKIAASDPRWAKGFADAGFDVNNAAHVGPAIAFMREEALGAQAPESKALTVARTGQANREKLETDQSLYDFGQRGQPQGQPGATPQPVIQGGTTLKTQEQREAAAARLGLQPGSMEYNDLIANGHLREVVPDHKAIQTADDKVRQAQELLNNIRLAKTVGANMEGGGYAYTAPLLEKFGGSTNSNAITMYDNLIQNSIAPSLKTIFPQRVTNTDLNFVTGLQSSAKDSATVRADKLTQAERRAEQLLEWANQDSRQLRQGAYYKPGGGPTGAGAKPPPNAPQNGEATGERVPRQFTDRLPQTGAQGQIPPEAVRFLQAHPETAGAFQEKYKVDPSQFLQQR